METALLEKPSPLRINDDLVMAMGWKQDNEHNLSAWNDTSVHIMTRYHIE